MEQLNVSFSTILFRTETYHIHLLPLSATHLSLAKTRFCGQKLVETTNGIHSDSLVNYTVLRAMCINCKLFHLHFHSIWFNDIGRVRSGYDRIS